MRKTIMILSLLAMAAVLATPGDAKLRCERKWKDRPEFKISPCRLFLPWGFGCKTCEDLDLDGINDCDDQCLGTPEGAVVDASGCPVDTDMDGVFDGLDKCPGTPKGARVDKKGCPSDSDGDGVLDGLDRCPGTPRGAEIDDAGCPIDSDGDGVFDGLDECPDTPKELAVNENGCPIVVSEMETKFLDAGMISTTTINFELNRDELLADSYATLDEIGEVLVKWPSAKVEIGGHTDSQGSAEYNMKLSEQRAQAVRAYLVSKYPELDAGNLTAKGYGETAPVADNDTKEGRAQNRRVEFTVTNREELKKEIERKGYKKR